MKAHHVPDNIWDIVMGIAGEVAALPPSEIRLGCRARST